MTTPTVYNNLIRWMNNEKKIAEGLMQLKSDTEPETWVAGYWEGYTNALENVLKRILG